jgi:predicted RNase H-like HicB family nuclease
MPTVEFIVKVPIAIKKKENIFVAACPVLDVFSQGETEEEAHRNIGEALRLFITTCFERGTLEDVLKQCGFKPIKRHVTLPKNHRFISIPIPFSVSGTCATACHA